jgi:hypothetical protein
MKFDLNNLNPGTWFDFEDGARVSLRLPDASALNSIKKQTTKKKVPKGSHFPIEETDDEKYNELLWDYIIVEWEGLYDIDGKPIPCNKEMKVLLMNNSLIFAHWASQRIEELRMTLSEEEEELEKN